MESYNRSQVLTKIFSRIKSIKTSSEEVLDFRSNNVIEGMVQLKTSKILSLMLLLVFMVQPSQAAAGIPYAEWVKSIRNKGFFNACCEVTEWIAGKCAGAPIFAKSSLSIDLETAKELGTRNANYPEMTRMAAFAGGCYGNVLYPALTPSFTIRNLQFTQIEGYDLIKSWRNGEMWLFKRPAFKVTKDEKTKLLSEVDGPDYVFVFRGTQVSPSWDVYDDTWATLGSVPERLPKLFIEMVRVLIKLPKGSEVNVVGHSLGGYISTMVVAMLHLEFYSDTENPGVTKVFNEMRDIDKNFDIMLYDIKKMISDGHLKITCHAFSPAVWAHVLKLWGVISGQDTSLSLIEYKVNTLFNFYAVEGDPIIRLTHVLPSGTVLGHLLASDSAAKDPIADDDVCVRQSSTSSNWEHTNFPKMTKCMQHVWWNFYSEENLHANKLNDCLNMNKVEMNVDKTVANDEKIKDYRANMDIACEWSDCGGTYRLREGYQMMRKEAAWGIDKLPELMKKWEINMLSELMMQWETAIPEWEKIYGNEMENMSEVRNALDVWQQIMKSNKCTVKLPELIKEWRKILGNNKSENRKSIKFTEFKKCQKITQHIREWEAITRLAQKEKIYEINKLPKLLRKWEKKIDFSEWDKIEETTEFPGLRIKNDGETTMKHELQAVLTEWENITKASKGTYKLSDLVEEWEKIRENNKRENTKPIKLPEHDWHTIRLINKLPALLKHWDQPKPKTTEQQTDKICPYCGVRAIRNKSFYNLKDRGYGDRCCGLCAKGEGHSDRCNEAHNKAESKSK